MARHFNTIIVGGGISGLACARRLSQAHKDFLLITDRLGGRMYSSPAGINYGASYVTTDYRRTRPFIDRGARIWMKDVYFHDGKRYVTLFDPSNIGRLGEFKRLYGSLIDFRRRINRLRDGSLNRCPSELLAEDAILCALTEEPAPSFVERRGLEEITDIFADPIVRSTVFVRHDQVNAFYYLACLMPALLSTYIADLRRTVVHLSSTFRDRILLATVTGVDRGPARFDVSTEDQELTCNRLVLAAPEHNVRQLIDIESTTKAVPTTTLHIKGQRRKEYKPGKTVFLRADHPATVLWPQPAGGDIVFVSQPQSDLSRYYESYAVEEAVTWKTAVQLSDHRWRALEPRPGLFVIGDYNVCGLEDSFISGLYSANRIIVEGG